MCRHCYGTDVVGGWEGPRHATAKRVAISYDRWPDIPSEDCWSCSFRLPFTVYITPRDLVLLSGERWIVVHVESSTNPADDQNPEGWRVEARVLHEFEPGKRFLEDRRAGP